MVATKRTTQENLTIRLTESPAPSGIPGEVTQQIRQVLALCQVNNQKPLRPGAYRYYPSGATRLLALVELATTLNTQQLARLVTEIEQISNDELRMILLSRISHHLPPDKQREIVMVLWRNIRNLTTPAAATQILFRLFPLVDEIQTTPPPSFMAVFDIAHSIDNLEARTRSLIALSRYVTPDLTLTVQRAVLDAIENVHDDTIRTNTIVSIAETLATELVERALECAFQIHTPDARVRALTVLARYIPASYTKRVHEAALSAIEGIVGEEPRVEALIAFAPYLEEYMGDWTVFPAMLERALTIAVNIPRRHFRARALVALAPHLPAELQGEALAAVHSLTNERDRAMLLAKLAFDLEPDMLVASLAVAHTMQGLDSRVYALTALAQRVPEHAREQTLHDAFEAALSLPRPFERVAAIIELVSVLPVRLRSRAFDEALQSTDQIENPNTRARALNMLGINLPDHRIPELVKIAQSLEDPQRKLSALSALVQRIPTDKQLPLFEEMLTIIYEIRYEFRRARALVSIAALLPKSLIMDALNIAQEIYDPYDRITALIALAQNSPPNQRPAMVGEAWRLIKQVESGYDRASALAAIAPLLPPEAEDDLTHAVGMAIGSIMDEYDQASAIILLAPLLASDKSRAAGSALPEKINVLRDGLRLALRSPNQPERVTLLREGIKLWMDAVPITERAVHNALWSDLLQRIGNLPLADAILCIAELRPLVQLLGGDVATSELALTLGLQA